MKIKLKSDKFKKARGGGSKLLEIKCQKCGTLLFLYQKDGPGSLKRMYLDRIYKHNNLDLNSNIICSHCQALIAIPMIYKKENREALRLIGPIIKSKIK